MSLARDAYEELYGEKPRQKLILKYHGRLQGYNATVSQRGNVITFRLSRKLEHCEPEIKKGVMQYLLNKLKKTKHHSDDIDLYHTFVKRMSDYAPVTETDNHLEASFNRVNETYFHGMMSRPNLVWGNRTMSLLGTYAYGTDTIRISRVLEEGPEVLLDYVVYHEMLHKKHKFSCSSGRTHSHTPAFKRDERKFHDKAAEEKLNRFLRGARRRKKVVQKSTFLQRLMGWH